MSQTQKLIVGALTDFVLTAGTAVVAIGHMPDAWGWTAACIGGLLGAAKHVRGMLLEPEK